MLERLLSSRFLRFLTVGATATLIQYAILALLVEAFGIDPALASATGFALSAVANYSLNRSFTFRSSVAHRIAVFRFAAVVVLGLAVTYGLMHALTWIGMHYLLAQVITTIVVLLLNFTLGSLWTFK